jgi:hypothetical protein
MAINTRSKEADKLANLYRAAFYIAKGAEKIGLDLIKKTDEKFPEMDFSSDAKRMYWAEKVLDRYVFLKNHSN